VGLVLFAVSEYRKTPVVAGNHSTRKTFGYWLLLACALSVGILLRCYSLTSQVLVDDEWHSMAKLAADQFSYGNLLTHFDAHDNTSVPLNVYCLSLYYTFGWSEWAIRLPVVVAGILCVVLLPLLLRPVLGDRVSLVTAWLLAISPFLVFYSRFFRAYSFVVLLGFTVLLLAYHWLTTGRRRYAVGFFLTGLAAVYMHLVALFAVFAPLAAALGIAAVQRVRAALAAEAPDGPARQEQLLVPLKSILLVGLGFALGLVPMALLVLQATNDLPLAKGDLSPAGLLTAATLASGTCNVFLNLLFFSLWIAGHVWLGRRKPVLSWIFLATLGAYVVAIVVFRPTDVQQGRVLLRYAIVALPIGLTMVALATDELLRLPAVEKLGRAMPPAIISAGVLGFCAAGPLPAIYVYDAPNNFTNHAAFQGAYTPLNWETSDAPPRRQYPGPVIDESEVSPFYRTLCDRTDVQTIIEFPYDVCDFNNLFYYYQHFHRKRVLMGYSSDLRFGEGVYSMGVDDVRNGFAPRSIYPDGMIVAAPNQRKIHFQNIIDIMDSGAVRRSGADVLVLHKFALVLASGPSGASECHIFYRVADLVRDSFRRQFGAPVYEDAAILCYRVRKAENGKD
jgi:hypothetical protein